MGFGLDDLISVATFGIIDGGDVTGSNAADAADKAAQIQYNATMEGIKAQKEALSQQRQDLSPFRNLAFSDYSLGFRGLRPAGWSTVRPPGWRGPGFNKTDTSKPGASIQPRSPIDALKAMALERESYAYNPAKDQLLNNALNRTTRAVMDAQAARGKLGSGSTLTSLMEAMAPQYMQREQQVFDQRYNTNNQQYNQLQNIVGMAQNAAAGQGAATQNATNNITSMMGQGANALAAGNIGAANAQAQGVNNLLGLGMMGLGLFA